MNDDLVLTYDCAVPASLLCPTCKHPIHFHLHRNYWGCVHADHCGCKFGGYDAVAFAKGTGRVEVKNEEAK